MAKPCEPLNIDRIIQIHGLVMDASGGLYSGDETDLINKGSLEHVLEASLFPVFGEMRYESLFDKAGALAHTIICAHVFRDGNKRTALICCMAMCEINGYSFAINKEAEDFFVRIAAESLSWQEVSAWIKAHAKLNKKHQIWLN